MLEHLKPLKIEEPRLLRMMQNIKGLIDLKDASMRKTVPALEKQLHDEKRHLDRLVEILHGRAAELLEGLQLYYGIGEPEQGYTLQFDFKKKIVRKVKVPTPKEPQIIGPFGMPMLIPGDEWKIEEIPEIDETQIDWENPEEVKVIKIERAKRWKEIQDMRDDGIDWRDKEEIEKEEQEEDDDEDGNEPPEMNILGV